MQCIIFNRSCELARSEMQVYCAGMRHVPRLNHSSCSERYCIVNQGAGTLDSMINLCLHASPLARACSLKERCKGLQLNSYQRCPLAYSSLLSNCPEKKHSSVMARAVTKVGNAANVDVLTSAGPLDAGHVFADCTHRIRCNHIPCTAAFGRRKIAV